MNLSKIREKLITNLNNYINYSITLKKNELLHKKVNLNNNICILLEGNYILKHHTPDPNGKNFSLGYYKNTGIIIPNLNGKDTFSSFFIVKTLSKCTFGVIPLEKINLKKILQKDLEDYYYFSFKRLYLQMRDITIYSKELALISIFIRLANSYGKIHQNSCIINFRISNKVLAEFIGTSPETISRLLIDFKTRKLISITKNSIIINNFDKLKTLLGCKYCDESLCEF